jgi:hypothetical protein
MLSENLHAVAGASSPAAANARSERGTRERKSVADRLDQIEDQWIAIVVAAGITFEHAGPFYSAAKEIAEEAARGLSSFAVCGEQVALRHLSQLSDRILNVQIQIQSIAKRVSAVERRRAIDCPVILRGQGKSPEVLSRSVPPLTSPCYKLIEALIEAGEEGLSKGQLDDIATNGPKYLRNLKKAQPDTWGRVILMAGNKGNRYRIASSTVCSP